MDKSVIFVAGVYGVGKSTLCNKLENHLKIPAFSSGDLISKINGEVYGRNKVVKDKEANQNVLISAVEERLKEFSIILLAGHFCIFNTKNEIDILPEFVYKRLHLSKIVLLEAENTRIINNLQNRDKKIIL